MKRSASFRWVIGLAIVVALGLLGGLWLRAEISRYFRSEAFRELVSQKASEALKLRGEFSTLRWSGSEVYAESYTGSGVEALRSLQAQGLRAQLVWRSLWQGKWEIERLDLQRAKLEFANRQQTAPPSALPAPAAPPRAWWMAWLPQQLHVAEIVCQSTEIRWGESVLEGSRVTLRPEGQAWLVEARGGRLQHPAFPENTVQILRARLVEGAFYLTESQVELPEGGLLTCRGEALWREKTSQFSVDFSGLPAEKIGPEGWRQHLTGQTSGELTIRHNPAGRQITGTVVVSDGMLQGLPVQDVLARFTRSPQFKRLPLQELSARFRLEPDGTRVESLVLESRGLLRVEGELEVGPHTEADPTLRGDLAMGLTSQTLRWLPGSQERIFRTSRGGYLWADLQLSGTLHHPQEDLSRRLALVMGEQVLLAPTNLLQEGGLRALEGGVDLLSEGKNLLRNGTNTATEGVQSALDLLTPLLPGKR